MYPFLLKNSSGKSAPDCSAMNMDSVVFPQEYLETISLPYAALSLLEEVGKASVLLYIGTELTRN